ncbi:MAG TPA: hypothetical protein VGN61_14605 [Verrucomicrobiae bacterium]|jgi:hypothetical protein
MRRIGLLLSCLAIFFGFLTAKARAQASCQIITFSVLGDYQDATNNASTEPLFTNQFIQPLLFTSGNVVKAILLDLKGTQWTNWPGAHLERQVNLVTGEEGIYITLGGKDELNVSPFFGDTYVGNFTGATTNTLGFATNNFTYGTNALQNPFTPMYNGTASPTTTNRHVAAGMHYLSLNTTNLKFNLVGVSLFGIGNGEITTFTGTSQKTNHYSVPIDREVMNVIGSYSWNKTTNFYSPITNVAGVFHSGPARGTVIVGTPVLGNFTPVP